MKPSSLTRWHASMGIAAAATLLATCPVPASAKGKPGGGSTQDVAVTIHFDSTHAITAEPSGITSDGASYPDGNGIQAFVGRNNGVWLYLGGSGRTVNIDLGQPLGGAGSVPVDLVTDEIAGGDVTILSTTPDGRSDFCYHDPASPTPLRPQPPATLAVDAERFEIAAGVDLDDLQVGCSVETNARLRFQDSAGSDWRLMWGPRQIPGGAVPNPRSAPIRLTRVNQAVIGGQTVDGNFWFFETTGSHLAALHRRENPQAGSYYEYYGQFRVPFSGYAVAQTYDPARTGNHCELNIPNIGAGLIPSQVALSHDPLGNLLTATAIDQSDDFSASSNSFDWYADGQLVAGGIGNVLDLSTLPQAGTITVFATHPDWLAQLPSLLTIAQGDVEGSASFNQGSGGGETISLDPVGWSFPRNGKDIQVVLAVVDSSGAPAVGVDVIATLAGPSGSGISEPIAGSTGSNGQVSTKLKDAPGGTWCVTIHDVQAPNQGATWDAAQPANGCISKD